jgi:hypothetical protein
VRADRRAAHQQLGPALYPDGGFCPAPELVLDGQARAFSAPPFGALSCAGSAAFRSTAKNPSNLVAASVEALRAADGQVQLTVPPEGTRSKVRYWKTGFYHIAQGAQRADRDGLHGLRAQGISGLGPVFHPTGDIERDMETIKAFYAPFKGKNPDQSGR